ncbi:hypothetical protein BV372_00885 [Nostoc sp. T09]|uniref:hypothetical protein n=1 Tax=Nostoc sp. T09 TaxID=1932621 RepID=UPI000A381FA4|nr:hypothetical protein [Nostoc sp. T09]OUL37551.1 hypothetical protein BV372_00885 [Nostoc sp. T09]
MFSNLFCASIPEPPTPFEKDIDALIEILKNEVSRIYHKNPPSSCIGMWIYGTKLENHNTLENQDMLIFRDYANKLVIKYSHNLTETEPKNISEVYKYLKQKANNKYVIKQKNLAVEVVKWIDDTQLVSQEGNLDKVLATIEALKDRVSNFKDRKPFLSDPFQSK